MWLVVRSPSGYHDAGRLASHAGLAPVPRDSGRRTGNRHRTKPNRPPGRLFRMSARSAMMRPGPSREYCLEKRAEGLIHAQALLTLARRRVDALREMRRDQGLSTSTLSVTQTA